MNNRKLIEALTIDDIRFFLERSGWQKVDIDSRFRIKYKYMQEDIGLEIVLPQKKDSVDFILRIEDIIRTLSSLYGKQQTEIIRQLYAFDRDFVNLRLIDKNVYRNTIPLFLADRVIRSLAKLLKFAAAQVEKTRAYYMRPPEKAVKYSEVLRFGHTFEGSFGFSVESPLNLPSIGMPEITINAPFARLAVERVYDGLEIVEKATKDGSSAMIVDNIDSGFNANMCEAIVEISEEIQAVEVAYNFGWSPMLPISDMNKSVKTFILSPGSYRVLEDATRQLKNDVDELDTTISGAVTILKAPPGFLVHEDAITLVTINGKTDTGIYVNITTHLKTEDYKLACDAHRDGKFVLLRGHLVRGINRRWEITEYSKFSIIDEK